MLPPRILLIEDNPADAELMLELLSEGGAAEPLWVTSLSAGLTAIEVENPDVVILDLMLPDAGDLDGLAQVKQKAPHIPIVVLTGHDHDATAVRALQNGAQDYLVKGQVGRRALLRSLRYAIERQRFELERELFLGAVGHDLRNPLAAVRMAAGLMLADDDDLSAKTRMRAAKIANAADRMTRMIEQLLSFSRGRAGGLTLERRDLDLVQLCRTVVEEVELAHPDATVVVAAPADAHGEWDHDRLVQVVQNLVTNAVAHGRPGRPVHVRLMAGTDADADVVLEVDNDCAPLADDELDELFHPFRRNRRRGPGLGLGLSIAHQLVTAHGGTIAARSRDGGIIFTVRLPAAEQHVSPGEHH